jgi:hypothetical protein
LAEVQRLDQVLNTSFAQAMTMKTRTEKQELKEALGDVKDRVAQLMKTMREQ